MTAVRQREAEVFAEVDAVEKRKDFALAAQVSELQWRAEALGRGLRDLGRLRDETSDTVVVVEGQALLGRRGELEEKIGKVESSIVRFEADVLSLKKTIAAAGAVTVHEVSVDCILQCGLSCLALQPPLTAPALYLSLSSPR